MEASFAVESRLDETLPDECETTQLFRDFKAALRATGFRTPLQRASSVAQNISAASVTLKRVAEADSLRTILPPGPNTVHRADIAEAVACSCNTYFIRLPTTVLWTAEKATVLSTGFDGSVKVRPMSNLRSAMNTIFAEVARAKPFAQKFVVKRKGEQSLCLNSVSEVEKCVLGGSRGDLRVQLFIEPQTRKAGQLRAHWSQGRGRNAYFAHLAGARLKNAPQSLAKRITELSHSFSTAKVQQPHGQLTRMRLKPIEEIDNSLSESVKALNDTLKNLTVTQLLCDFVQDLSSHWVLVGCLGYVHSPHRKVVSQIVEQKQLINLNFILYPLFMQKQSVKKRMHDQRNSSADFRRMSVVGEFVESKEAPKEAVALRTITSQVVAKKEIAPIPLPELGFYHSTISKYDQVMSRVNKHKEQLTGKLNFISKYGEAFWTPVLLEIYTAFRKDDRCLTKYYDHLNFEEQGMILRGYKRVLQGSYNFYYESVLTLAHCSKGITHQEYESFLGNAEKVLLDTPIARRDLGIIMKRFRDMRSCICSRVSPQ